MLFSVGDDAAFFSSGAEEKNAADDTKQVLGRVVVARKADAPAAGASNHPKKRPNTALVVVIAETTLLLPASLHEEKNIRLILEDCRPRIVGRCSDVGCAILDLALMRSFLSRGARSAKPAPRGPRFTRRIDFTSRPLSNSHPPHHE